MSNETQVTRTTCIDDVVYLVSFSTVLSREIYILRSLISVSDGHGGCIDNIGTKRKISISIIPVAAVLKLRRPTVQCRSLLADSSAVFSLTVDVVTAIAAAAAAAAIAGDRRQTFKRTAFSRPAPRLLCRRRPRPADHRGVNRLADTRCSVNEHKLRRLHVATE